jgi:CDP-paratose 2-epimerase
LVFLRRHKLASELFLPEFQAFLGVDFVINRFGVLAGPGQFGKVDQGVTVLWVARYFFKKELSYIGFGENGKQVRDALHIHDFCRAVEWQMLNFEKCKNQNFNIGGGIDCSFSLLELTALCERVSGEKIVIHKVHETRSADIPLYITDNSKFTALSGWRPEKGPEDIVRDIFEWIKLNRETLKSILE